jgi:glycerol-3-phosphate dehydrogenase
MYSKLNSELNFGFRETGALVKGFDDEDDKKLRELYQNGLKVGCNGLEIIYEHRIKDI